MKNCSFSFRPWCMAASLSVVALLAACGEGGPRLKNPFASDRPAQMVEGARRPPELNPQAMPAPMVQQVAPVPPSSPQTNPYDYYDEHGNVAPPSAPAESESKGLLQRLFGSTDNTTTEERKPFPANPSYSQETAEVAPLAPPPESIVTPPPVAAPAPAMPPAAAVKPWPSDPSPPIPQRPSPVMAETAPAVPSSAVQPYSAVPVAPAPAQALPWSGSFIPYDQEAPEDEDDMGPSSDAGDPGNEEASVALSKPSWLPSWLGGDDAQADETPQAFPALSSVPPVPEEFKEIKAERQLQMEELQADHLQALQEKQALDNEPSQQPAEEAPVSEAFPSHSTPAPLAVAPVSSPPVPAVTNPERSVTQELGEPVLLGRASQPVDTTGQSDAASVMPPVSLPEPLPVEAAATAEEKPEEEKAETPNANGALPSPQLLYRANAAQPQP